MTDQPITLEIIEGPEQTVDADGWEHYAYVVELQREDHPSMRIPWRQGLAITEDPSPRSVLENLLSDATGYLNSPTFESWAPEYGYDTDSRKALAIFEQVAEQTERLRALLGEDFDSALWGDDHEQSARRLAECV